ncbi:hypothetical protein E3Q22_03812 [Wallemia mellicola]|uniref:Thioredoxin domain-containing protein n=1 Tax=Wallemia mellicola TaxID=1708541 RepID=A0A4T0M0F3_9BASI|nr:hypothetical protein E3Q22_03812 [Wallemia mellicola]
MALKYGDKVKFISIDVDQLPQLCNRVLGVRFMPVIIAVKNGIKFKHIQSKVPMRLKEFIKTVIIEADE